MTDTQQQEALHCYSAAQERDGGASEDNAMRQHLRMMISVVQLKLYEEPPVAVSVTTKHSEYLVNLPPVKFIISDFTGEKGM